MIGRSVLGCSQADNHPSHVWYSHRWGTVDCQGVGEYVKVPLEALVLVGELVAREARREHALDAYRTNGDVPEHLLSAYDEARVSLNEGRADDLAELLKALAT